MIEISGKLFRLDSIDHIDGEGRTLPAGGQGARITLRSGEWIYVDETYAAVAAIVFRAIDDARRVL